MVTKTSIVEIVKAVQARHGDDCRPIYELVLFVHPDKEMVSPSGKALGWPDTGGSYTPGFYYDIEDAIAALNENACDIREAVYNAAFLICRFPGIYDEVGPERRMYFVWNADKEGYFQTEEPEIFRHITY